MSVYKRGRMYWYKFQFSLKLSDGSRESFFIRRSSGMKTARKAQEIENEHQRVLRLGLVHPRDPWPQPEASTVPVFRAFTTKEFLSYTQTHTKPGTQKFYKDAATRLLNFSMIADSRLDKITNDMASAYARHRQAIAENSVVSVNGDLRTLRRILRFAVANNRLTVAPIIHELPQPKGRERVVSPTEEAKYLAKASKNLRDAAILAVDTGLRPQSELFVLCWDDCDLEGNTAVIHVRDGKTDSAQRTVPLTPRALEVLKRRRDESKKSKTPSRFVFPGAGNSGHLASMQHPHEQAIVDAGIEPFPFYVWRHTFGTRCAESGMDKFTLARLMGHSAASVAERYYIHVTSPHVTANFDKFVAYSTRQIAEGLQSAFPEASVQVQ